MKMQQWQQSSLSQSHEEEPSSSSSPGENILEQAETFYEFLKAREKSNQLFVILNNQRTANGQKLLRGQLLNYNRKQKSLEELSRRFLELYVREDDSVLELDKITIKLGVERRRIYDIINILQSLKVVIRSGKNLYKWNGLQRVAKTIQEYESETSEPETPKLKKEKSLQVLSIGFLKLFVHWKKTLSLEEAAKKLVGQMQPQKLKTKVRRLYDIANVFKSLGLVKKTSLPTRKPGFEWVGISGLTQMFRAKTESDSPPMEIQPEPLQLQSKPTSFFSEHVIKQLGATHSIDSILCNWKATMWSNDVLPLTKSRSLCQVTAEKMSILKERTNEKTADTRRKSFGSFRKIQIEELGKLGDCTIEPKVLFSS